MNTEDKYNNLYAEFLKFVDFMDNYAIPCPGLEDDYFQAIAEARNVLGSPPKEINVFKENEELRTDLLKVVIDSGEVLKNHTSLMAHIERLHYSLAEIIHAVQPSEPCTQTDVDILKRANEIIRATPLQSLNRLEAGAVRKVASILCSTAEGKNLISHTALIKYAEKLEQLK